MENTSDSFWYTEFLDRLRECERPEVNLMSDDTGLTHLAEMESRVDSLLGLNPFRLGDLRESAASVAGAQHRLLELCKGADRVLGRWGLVGVVEALAHVPTDLTDRDLLFLKRVLIPVAKGLVRTNGSIHPRALGAIAIKNLERLKELPTVPSTRREFEEFLHNRIALEFIMTRLLLEVCGFSGASYMAETHTDPEGGFDATVTPQIFAAEALEFVRFEVRAEGQLAASIDNNVFHTTIKLQEGVSRSSPDYSEAVETILEPILAKDAYRRSIEPNRSFEDLPVVTWEDEDQTVLKLAFLGAVFLDFSDGKRLKTLLRIRAALKYTLDNKTRLFDLDEVIKVLPLTDRNKLSPKKGKRYKSERWRHDAFDKHPTYFDILFQPAGRGENGKYLVNVRLDS